MSLPSSSSGSYSEESMLESRYDSRTISPESLEDLHPRDFLPRISIQMMHLMNAGDLTDPLVQQYLSPEFQNKMITGHDTIYSMEDDSYATEKPACSAEIWADCAHVRGSRATVWLTSRMNGYFCDHLRRDSVSKIVWQRIQGQWKLMRHTGIVGACALLEVA